MSGAGCKGKYRKKVTEEYLTSFPVPEGSDKIAQCMGTRGSNIFEVCLSDNELADKEKHELALLPSKYSKVIWVKTKDYLILEGCEETESPHESSSKVKYIIKHILNKDQIKHIKKSKLWPVNLSSPHNRDKGIDPMAVMTASLNASSLGRSMVGYGDEMLLPPGAEATQNKDLENDNETVLDKMGNTVFEAVVEAGAEHPDESA